MSYWIQICNLLLTFRFSIMFTHNPWNSLAKPFKHTPRKKLPSKLLQGLLVWHVRFVHCHKGCDHGSCYNKARVPATENVLSPIRTKLLCEKWFGGSPTESQVLVLNPAERDRPLPKHSDCYSRDFDSFHYRRIIICSICSS